jgi:hypothetical protein
MTMNPMVVFLSIFDKNFDKMFDGNFIVLYINEIKENIP